MIIELKTLVSEGEKDRDVVTGEDKFVETNRYERIYKVDVNAISHWNVFDEDDDLVEVHLISGAMIPVLLTVHEFEDSLAECLSGKNLPLSDKERGLKRYLYDNKLERDSEESS